MLAAYGSSPSSAIVCLQMFCLLRLYLLQFWLFPLTGDQCWKSVYVLRGGSCICFAFHRVPNPSPTFLHWILGLKTISWAFIKSFRHKRLAYQIKLANTILLLAVFLIFLIFFGIKLVTFVTGPWWIFLILLLYGHEIITKSTVLDIALLSKDFYSPGSYLQLTLNIILEDRFIFYMAY